MTENTRAYISKENGKIYTVRNSFGNIVLLESDDGLSRILTNPKFLPLFKLAPLLFQ